MDGSVSQQRAYDELSRARARILAFVEEVTDAELRRQWLPILSPMVWDLAHVGNYEDLWLVQTLAGERVTPAGLDELYDAFRQPRDVRESLPLLGPDEARTYITAVRDRSLRAIDDGLLDPARAATEGELLRDGFVLGLVVQHEHQHAETILQARQAMGERATALEHVGATAASTRTAAAALPGEQPLATRWLHHPGGTGTIGTSADPWAYDNERPAHAVSIDPFRIARDAVTNAQWIEFIEAGGYTEPGWWHPDGWQAVADDALTAPAGWRPSGDGTWQACTFGAWHEVDPAAPVQHVSWWEADAFARFAGARLPTELEWEAAARWRPDGSTAPESRLDGANVGARYDGPVAPGLLTAEPSPCGCRAMLGNTWEWTASRFEPWPGFTVFPYAEYSKEFFGGNYRVLRGGSWATDELVCRSTFRNWDHPQRRQLFAGLRLADG
ncbi:MAG: hypothetical protein JWM86_861 [Thermoleophilia bacterium]|nr:hypothetical protein [Thermoleophilia bacterium]